MNCSLLSLSRFLISKKLLKIFTFHFLFLFSLSLFFAEFCNFFSTLNSISFKTVIFITSFIYFCAAFFKVCVIQYLIIFLLLNISCATQYTSMMIFLLLSFFYLLPFQIFFASLIYFFLIFFDTLIFDFFLFLNFFFSTLFQHSTKF